MPNKHEIIERSLNLEKGKVMSNNKYLIIGIVVSLAILSVLSTDFYVPAMPDMAHMMATSHYLIKLTVSVYMLGLALSPLAFGPLSDRFGRRPILLVCGGLGLVGSILCWLAPVAQVLILSRLIQGIGLGGALSLARTIGSDLFDKNEFAQVAGVLSLCTSVGPAIAPVIGGYLHVHFGWRSIFLLLSVLVLSTVTAIIRKVPETIEKIDPHALRLQDLVTNYRELLANKLFMCNTLVAGLSISTLILFGVLSTFILQNVYHLSTVQYGWIMMLVTTASVISRTANIVMLKTRTPEQCINIGLFFMLIGSFFAVLMSALGLHYLLSIIIPSMVIIFGAGIIPSNTAAIALIPFRHKGGSAGAIYGFVTMLSVFAISLAGSFLPATALALGLMLLTISVLSLVIIKLASTPEETLLTA